jgi:E3 ubiquitin-protein ligase KEG
MGITGLCYIRVSCARRRSFRFLFKRGADANALDFYRRTALHYASDYRRAEVARALLEHGVDVNTRDAENATPLHLASDRKPHDAVRLLLQYCACIRARDDEGQTSFMDSDSKRTRRDANAVELSDSAGE